MNNDVGLAVLIALLVSMAGATLTSVVYINNTQWNKSLELCIKGGGKPVECMETLRYGRR